MVYRVYTINYQTRPEKIPEMFSIAFFKITFRFSCRTIPYQVPCENLENQEGWVPAGVSPFFERNYIGC
jgi:hypothetical protein